MMKDTDTSVWIAGALSAWPQKQQMAAILRAAGLNLYVGQYSIRIKDCSHFVFQQYGGGDMSEPRVDADADSLEQMMRDAKLVSDALARGRIRHRFEIYDSNQKMVGYLHHRWPAGH